MVEEIMKERKIREGKRPEGFLNALTKFGYVVRLILAEKQKHLQSI
jgi:hypothetical protein